MLEKELKFTLTQEEYGKIEAMFSWDSQFTQINTYYNDRDRLLEKNGITFRIRTKNDINMLQIKKHIKTENALNISEETEEKIADIPKSFPSEKVFGLTGIKTDAFCIGSLRTLRHTLMYDVFTGICLDKNNYLGTEDYELEIEYTKELPANLLDKFKNAGISLNTSASGKRTRFMNFFYGLF